MRKLLYLFLSWRLLLFLVAFIAILVIPKFGSSFPYANTVLEPTKLPSWIWGFGNFDGVHYLRIAQNGYADANYQAFFPLYPLLIRFLNVFPRVVNLDTRIFVDPSFFYTGFLLSNLFLFLSLVVVSKITSKKNYLEYILFLLCFPTAFYFGAVYTESLFLFELLLFILFMKKRRYLGASFVASMASATRLIGILLSLILLIEVVKNIYRGKIKLWSSNFYKSVISLAIAPSGLLTYMFYLRRSFGDYFSFVTVQSGFGAERAGVPIITLPQVFYRYAKMLLTIKNNYQIFSVSLELVFAIVGLILIIWAYSRFQENPVLQGGDELSSDMSSPLGKLRLLRRGGRHKKIDFGWWMFCALVYLLPTLTGTFSSMPRYLIFLYVPLIFAIGANMNRISKIVVLGVMIVIQVILLSFFIRGYWIA